LNQQQRRGAQYVPFEAILGSDDEFDAARPPDLEHADRERREIIHQAMMELSPKLRAVVALKYLEGLSYEEIAEALECAPGTVASRLSRALQQLEARLRPLKRLL
jgi:RNA polymerase sigma-70 factor, ECF subfamily